MTDQSHLDLKYFIDPSVYNCPFCNRRHISYSNLDRQKFDWSDSKKCWIWTIDCDSCRKVSMHLTYEDLQNPRTANIRFRSDIDIDSHIFYSVPTSFFVVDSRIPKIIRELITEAAGCIKMNYMTGASACTRKAIYELLVLQKVEGEHYDDRIMELKEKHTQIDPEMFDILAHIQDMTSDNVHEQSWDKWESGPLTLILETVKTILHEIYVVPNEREVRKKNIRDLKAEVGGANIKGDSETRDQNPADDL